MIVNCSHCGKSVVVNGLGRKRLNITLKNICDALQAHHGIVAAARQLGCSPSYIFGVLKANKLKIQDVVKR